MVLGTALQTYGEKLTDQQEVLTSLGRHHHRRLRGGERAYSGQQCRRRSAALTSAAAQVFVYDAAGRVEIAARTALGAMAEGDALRTLLAALRRLLKISPVNTVARTPRNRRCRARTPCIHFLSVTRSHDFACRRLGRRVPLDVVMLAIVLSHATLAGPARSRTPDEINAWHATKDQFMRESDDSPIPAAQRASFPPLSYFPVSADYRVPAATDRRGRARR